MLQVIFHASGNQVHIEQLGIDVEDRAPEIHPEGVPLELSGESCIPGINAGDVEGIFEEHALRKEIDPSCSHGTVYGVTDKVANPTSCTVVLPCSWFATECMSHKLLIDHIKMKKTWSADVLLWKRSG